MRYLQSRSMSESADQYYVNLVQDIMPTDLNEWEYAITHAEQRRKQDRSVMDIIGTTQPSGDESSESADADAAPDTDVTHQWLRLGIVIEEMQYVSPVSHPATT